MAYTVTLRKPFTFEDKEYKELSLDFDKLGGVDILEAEKAYIRENPSSGPNTTVKELSKGFQVHVAAAASNVPVEVIVKLGAKDFVEVTLQTQNFLLREE